MIRKTKEVVEAEQYAKETFSSYFPQFDSCGQEWYQTAKNVWHIIIPDYNGDRLHLIFNHFNVLDWSLIRSPLYDIKEDN